ncbi:hypothetical protein EON83_28005 [bacterium]|nr:MAG: hypothetical protein EON83_28005 [bacterium]
MDAIFATSQLIVIIAALFLIFKVYLRECSHFTCRLCCKILKSLLNPTENHMRFYHRRQFERYQRCLDFINQHQKEFGPKSQAITLKDQLQSVVDELSKSSQSTPKAPRATSSQKQKANNDLRAALNRIARTASAIAAHDDSFKNTFALPDKRRKDELAGAARKFLKDGEKSRAAFESFDMPEEFLSELKAKLDAYESAQGSIKPAPKAKANPEGDSATIAKGSRIMESLDTLMDNKFHNNDAMLNEWHNSSDVEIIKRGSRKKKES